MNDIKKYYDVIGVDENVTDEELEKAYSTLKTKYQNDRFLEGEEGNIAAKKLTELNSAYEAVVDFRKERNFGENRGTAFAEIDRLIKANNINAAQAELDKFSERSAEWHYLQSVVFYKKNWINESKKQLEIAIQMDSKTEKYKNSYDKLCKQMDYNSKQSAKSNGNGNFNNSNQGNGAPNTHTYEEPTDMMGGETCLDYCCQLAICNMLLNCCCNCR